MLLRAGASPSAVGTNGMAPISIACMARNTPGPVRAEIVDMLLQAGADPRATVGAPPGDDVENHSGGGGSRGGWRAGGKRVIHLAACIGVAEVIPLLVAAGEDPGRRVPAGVSGEELQAGAIAPPLFIAAAAGHVDAVQALVAAGADVEATLDWRDAEGKVWKGVEGSCGGTGSGGGSGASGRGGGDGGGGWRAGGGLTPLCVAVQEGHVGVVRELVAAGANTRVLCKGGRTLLKVAREGGMVEMEEVLLAAEVE